MRKINLQRQKLKVLGLTMFFGVLVSLVTGLLENRPEFSIVEARYYGYPLVWRITFTFEPTEYRFADLAINTAFWVIVSLTAFAVLQTLKPKKNLKHKTLLFFLVLFIPLGLIMDLVHELGHALWGTVAGGRLTYMQVAFFQIFPSFTVTSRFILGYVSVDGLDTDFDRGLFLLGGSLSTAIAAWLLGLILLKTKFSPTIHVVLRLLGLFGLFDLPAYIIFPHIGLQHWIFLGGSIAEPLVGARLMGIPDLAFCFAVAVSTLGLVFLYSESIRKALSGKIETLKGRQTHN